VEFGGSFVDADGVAIGEGLGNVTDVVPGQVYKTKVLYDLDGAGRDGRCGVNVVAAI
jgi:hypothetical protein